MNDPNQNRPEDDDTVDEQAITGDGSGSADPKEDGSNTGRSSVEAPTEGQTSDPSNFGA